MNPMNAEVDKTFDKVLQQFYSNETSVLSLSHLIKMGITQDTLETIEEM